MLIYLSLFVLVGIACAWAGYQHALHSFWEVHIHGEDVYRPIEDHILHIGIMSPPENRKQRLKARKEWVHDARRHYRDKKIKMDFLIGQVPIQGNNFLGQGELVASETEKKIERDLQDEEKVHDDISRVPSVEANKLLQTDKALWFFRNAVSWKARFVMLTTDTQAINVTKVMSHLEHRMSIDALIYFGMDEDLNDAPTTDKTWFFDRHCFGMSGELAYSIVKTHLLHTMAFPAYGSTDVAANVARWVTYENHLRLQMNVAPVMHLLMPNISTNIKVPQPDPCTPVPSPVQ